LKSYLAQKPFKLPNPGLQLGFPGRLRIRLAVSILLFMGVKLPGGKIIYAV
jgi:hypothetical protein